MENINPVMGQAIKDFAPQKEIPPEYLEAWPELLDEESATTPEMQIERYLNRLNKINYAMLKINEHCDQLQARLDGYRAKQLEPVEKAIAYIEQQIKVIAESLLNEEYKFSNKKASLPLMFGKVKAVKTRERINIIGEVEDRFMKVREIKEPDKTAIKDMIHQTGDIPDYVDYTPGGDLKEIKIELAEDTNEKD